MKFTVERDDLVRELDLVAKAAATRGAIPILANVHIAVNGEESSCLRLLATDLEQSIGSICMAQSVGQGELTLPAKRLLDYVRLLPHGPISATVGDSHWITIKSGRAHTRMAGEDPASFPQIPRPDGPAVTIPAAALSQMIRRVIYAISREESRFTLNGALLITDEAGARMVATDGHQLAIASIDGNFPATRLLIPLGAMTNIQSLCAAAHHGADVRIHQDDNHCFFVLDDRSLVSRKMTGNFPDYERIIPSGFKGRMELDPTDMQGALRRVLGFADDRLRAVRIEIANGKLTVRGASSDKGDSQEEIPASIEGPDIEAGVNGAYVLGFLSVCDSERTHLSYNDAQSVLSFDTGAGLRYLVMPMRLS